MANNIQNLNDLFNNLSLVKKQKRSNKTFNIPIKQYGSQTKKDNKKQKKNSQYTGGFRRLLILNETPVEYPDNPYNEQEESQEREQIEQARRLYSRKQKLNLKGDPFKHREYEPIYGSLNLNKFYSLPLKYNFKLL